MTWLSKVLRRGEASKDEDAQTRESLRELRLNHQVTKARSDRLLREMESSYKRSDETFRRG